MEGNRVSEGESLLAYCYEHPEDDSARLVYADWLEESGDPDRAAFIRLDVRLDGEFYGRWVDSTLTFRHGLLLAANRDRWVADVPGPLRKKVEFRRGLPVHFTLSVKELLRHGPSLRRRGCLESVELAPVDRIRPALDSGLLAGVRGLALVNQALTDDDYLAVAACSDLGNLRRLRLIDCTITEPSSLALARSPHLARLVELDVRMPDPRLLEVLARTEVAFRIRRLRVNVGGWHPPREDSLDLNLVATAPCFSKLERLDVEYQKLANIPRFAQHHHLSKLRSICAAKCRLTDQDLAFLLASPHLTGLTTLDFTDNSLTASGAEIIARCPHLTRLETLLLSGNEVADRGLAALAASPHLKSLRTLHLDGCGLGDAGVIALAESPGLGRLRALHLFGNRITDRGICHLASAEFKLEDLGIFGIPLDAAGVERLVTSCPAGSLHRISLRGCGIDWRGAQAVAHSPHLGTLLSLDLAFNCIGGAGAWSIAHAANLPALRSLDLSHNAIGEDGARSLLQSPLLERLVTLNVTGNKIPRPLLSQFRERRGGRPWRIYN